MGNKSNKSRMHFGTILLVIAALVNVPRWVGLFTMSDKMPEWVIKTNLILEYIGGVLMGLTIAGGLAFVTHQIGGLRPFTEKGKPVIRFWGALLMDILIMTASGVLLPPYVRVLTPQVLRGEIGGALPAWSIVAVLVGDLIIVAIALVDVKAAGFTRSGTPQKGRSTTARKGKKAEERRTAKEEKRIADAEKRTAETMRAQCAAIAQDHRCTVPECGWTPVVDKLIAVASQGKDPKQSASSARAAHARHYHYTQTKSPAKDEAKVN